MSQSLLKISKEGWRKITLDTWMLDSTLRRVQVLNL